MTRRWRTRRVLKWIGTIASVALVIVYLTSFAWTLEVFRWGSLLRVQSGWVGFGYEKGWRKYPAHVSVTWNFERRRERVRFGRSYTLAGSFIGLDFHLPMWPVLIACAVPTVVLWWVDRHRYPPGHCQKCGYNLTGNVSGRCPECGQTTTKGQT